MTAEVTAGRLRAPSEFAPRRAGDRTVFLLLLGLVWLSLLSGFGLDVVKHFRVHEPPYPLLTHMHAGVAAGSVLALELLASCLDFSPCWKVIATHLIGH